MDLDVRWSPPLVDEAELATLAAAMPGPVAVLAPAKDARTVTLERARRRRRRHRSREAGEPLELPAPPPVIRNAADVAEAFVDPPRRLAVRRRRSPPAPRCRKRLDRWANPVTGAASDHARRPARPARHGRRLVPARCSGPAPRAGCSPIEQALTDSKRTKPLADELARLERICPELLPRRRPAPRPGVPEPGRGVGADDRHRRRRSRRPASRSGCPALSRRKPTPALRLFTEPTGDTVVGANQLSDVRWSAVFDDVELTAADVARLAAEARPLVQSRGQWVELDRVDLKEAAAALAERATTDAADRRRDPAPRRRPRGHAARRRAHRRGQRLGHRPARQGARRPARRRHAARGLRRRAAAPTRPRRSAGSASSTPSSSAAASPSTWASARRPTVLAHLARTAGDGPALVIAPPAVVGNWAAEAARFTPGLRVVVHHGASRAVGRGARGRGRRRRRRHHHLRHRRARHRGARRSATWDASCSTRPRPSRTRPTRRPSSCAASRPAPASRSPARRSRTASATSGRSSTSPTPASSAPAPRSSPSSPARARPPCARSTASSCSAAPRPSPSVAAELPDRIDELDHCTMTAEQIGLYQAVLDGLVADSAEAGGAPQAGRDPRRHHRAQADLQPPVALPARRPAAGRSLRQAHPARGDRRVGVRRRRAHPHLHPLRRVGQAARRPPHRGHRRRRSPATTAASPAAPATDWSRSSRRARAPARSCCR